MKDKLLQCEFVVFLQVKVPTDLPTSALNKISEVIETQRGNVHNRGEYVGNTLQVSGGSTVHGDTWTNELRSLKSGWSKL